MKFQWSPLGVSEVYKLYNIVKVQKIVSDSVNTNIVFAPFNTDSNDLVILIGKKELYKSSDVLEKKSKHLLKFSDQNFNTYRNSLHRAISDCKGDVFSKIVVSRKKEIIGNIDFDILFQELVRCYPNSFVYYFELDGINYLGATPERLLKASNRFCTSISLAGTMLSNEGSSLPKWGDKEKNEQQIVTDYLQFCFATYCLNIRVSERSIIENGPICHLHTEIKGELKGDVEINDLLGSLHPTPAVCGFPKSESKKWILDHEGYDRGFYSGYIGIVENQHSDYYVNLRCLRNEGDKTELFVGGGITKDSSVENEFRETEQKLNVLLSVIKKIHTFVN